MKETTENVAILKKMGFICDGDGNGWYSLKNGWGFCIDNISSIASLTRRLLKVENALMNGNMGLTIEDLPEIKKIVKKQYAPKNSNEPTSPEREIFMFGDKSFSVHTIRGK